MQVTQIELKVGVRLNVGDYQGVNAEITLRADLEPREGYGGAFDELRRNAVQQLAMTCEAAHPNEVRSVVTGNGSATTKALTSPLTKAADSSGPAQTAANGTTAEATTRKRRTKAEMEADRKAEEDRKKLAEQQLGETLELGGEDDGAGDGLDLGGEEDPLGGDGIPDEFLEEPITKDQLREQLKELVKAKGQAVLTPLLKPYGGKLMEVKEADYRKLYDAAKKALA